LEVSEGNGPSEPYERALTHLLVGKKVREERINRDRRSGTEKRANGEDTHASFRGNNGRDIDWGKKKEELNRPRVGFKGSSKINFILRPESIRTNSPFHTTPL